MSSNEKVSKQGNQLDVYVTALNVCAMPQIDACDVDVMYVDHSGQQGPPEDPSVGSKRGIAGEYHRDFHGHGVCRSRDLCKCADADADASRNKNSCACPVMW